MVEFPLGDLLVRVLELALLDLNEVIDVVLAAGRPQRRAQHFVTLKLAGRVEQVAGEKIDPSLSALGLAEFVQVELGCRLARIQLLLDAVQPAREQRRRRQVGIARPVDGAILDPAARRGYAASACGC